MLQVLQPVWKVRSLGVCKVISSFDSNFFPTSDLFKFENKISFMEPNLENTVDGAAFRSPTRSKSIFFFAKWGHFSAIWRRADPIIWHNGALWLLYPSPDSWDRSHPVNFSKRWRSPFRPIVQPSPSLEHVRRVKSPVSTRPWCSGVYHLIHISLTATKRWRNSFGLRLIASNAVLKWSHSSACYLKWATRLPSRQ